MRSIAEWLDNAKVGDDVNVFNASGHRLRGQITAFKAHRRKQAVIVHVATANVTLPFSVLDGLSASNIYGYAPYFINEPTDDDRNDWAASEQAARAKNEAEKARQMRISSCRPMAPERTLSVVNRIDDEIKRVTGYLRDDIERMETAMRTLRERLDDIEADPTRVHGLRGVLHNEAFTLSENAARLYELRTARLLLVFDLDVQAIMAAAEDVPE
jgi:hypothetical protein